MNARQAAKAAAERIKEMERVAAINKADIIDYNKCIMDMIAGKSPCDWCEDMIECQLQAKAEGKGCEDWMLRMQTGFAFAGALANKNTTIDEHQLSAKDGVCNEWTVRIKPREAPHEG